MISPHESSERFHASPAINPYFPEIHNTGSITRAIQKVNRIALGAEVPVHVVFDRSKHNSLPLRPNVTGTWEGIISISNYMHEMPPDPQEGIPEEDAGKFLATYEVKDGKIDEAINVHYSGNRKDLESYFKSSLGEIPNNWFYLHNSFTWDEKGKQVFVSEYLPFKRQGSSAA